MQQFSAGLQEFAVKLELETNTIKVLMSLTQTCEFVQTLLDKYSLFVKKSELQDYKTTGWLLFALARKLILQNRKDILESVDLMVSVLAKILLLFRSKEKKQDFGEVVGLLKERLQIPQGSGNYEAALIQIMEDLNHSQCSFQIGKQDLERLLNSKLDDISRNQDIDDRLFLVSSNSASNVKPTETPCIRTVPTPNAPRKSLFAAKVIPTQARIQLSFSDQAESRREQGARALGIKVYPREAIQSPFSSKPKIYSSTPLPTPMTAAIMMNSWLLESVKNIAIQNTLTPTLTEQYGERVGERVELVAQIVDELGSVISRNNILREMPHSSISRTQQLKGILLYFLEAMLDFQELPCFYASVGVCAAETILFIKNIQSIEFLALLKQVNLHPYQFHSILQKFLTRDLNLPLSLKHHFLVIRERILLEWAWMPDSPLTNSSDSQFLIQVLETASSRVVSILRGLSIRQGQREKVWGVVKHVIQERRALLLSRHIDQIVLCSLYVILGPVAMSLGLKSQTFSQIIRVQVRVRGRYKEEREQSILQAKLMISQVLVEEGRWAHIIEFYNSVFLPQVKDFIYNSRYIAKVGDSECERLFRMHQQRCKSGDGIGMTPRTMALHAPVYEKEHRAEERSRKILTQLKEEEEEEEEEEGPGYQMGREARMFGKSLFSARK